MNHYKTSKPVAVIGAGSFGTAVANIIAENAPVFLVTKDEPMSLEIKKERISAGQKLNDNILITHDLEFTCKDCEVIFVIIPSQDFFEAMLDLKNHLTDHHILIHGTKGLHINTEISSKIRKEDIFTMFDLMNDLLPTKHLGCMAGPNLAREIAEYKPAATVIASHSEKVHQVATQLLRSSRFQVLQSDDVFGIELCGVIKNVIAIAAGALSGFDLGENAKALLVNRGMVEMIHIGTQMGSGLKAFLGVAGIGDLMATCNSPKSRNFTVGYRLSKGENPEHIFKTMEETAEGVRTAQLIYHLSEHYGWKTPITKLVYKVLYDEFPIDKAISTLMKLPVKEDIDFID